MISYLCQFSFSFYNSEKWKTLNMIGHSKSLNLGVWYVEIFLEVFLYLLDPSRPDPGRREKISVKFYFHTSLWCLKRFYESHHKEVWQQKFKLIFILIQLSEMSANQERLSYIIYLETSHYIKLSCLINTPYKQHACILILSLQNTYQNVFKQYSCFYCLSEISVSSVDTWIKLSSSIKKK